MINYVNNWILYICCVHIWKCMRKWLNQNKIQSVHKICHFVSVRCHFLLGFTCIEAGHFHCTVVGFFRGQQSLKGLGSFGNYDVYTCPINICMIGRSQMIYCIVAACHTWWQLTELRRYTCSWFICIRPSLPIWRFISLVWNSRKYMF